MFCPSDHWCDFLYFIFWSWSLPTNICLLLYFFPYIISVLHLVIFLYICLILSLWLESVTLYLLKFMENTKKSTSIFFPNAYDSSAEYFQRFLFSSIYIFLNKERSVCMFNHKQGGQIILELGLALGLSVFLLLKNWTLGKHSYVFCYYMVIVSSAVFESHVEFILSPRYCGIGWVSVVLRERSSCSSGQHIEGHLGWGLSLVTMATWFKESLSTWDMETITIHIFQKYHELLIRSYMWKCTGSYIML